MNWTLQIVAFVPNLLWFVGTKWAGDRRRSGWMVLFFSEAAWAVLSVMAHLWSILPWTVLGFMLYWRNWKAWRQNGGRPTEEHGGGIEADSIQDSSSYPGAGAGRATEAGYLAVRTTQLPGSISDPPTGHTVEMPRVWEAMESE